MPNILEELYYVNLSPCQRAVQRVAGAKACAEAERPWTQAERIVYRETTGEIREVPRGLRRSSRRQMPRRLYHRLTPRSALRI